MDWVAEAPLQVDFDQLGDALGVTLDFVGQRCMPTADSKVSLFLSETGFKGVRLLAEAFPPMRPAFSIGRFDPSRLQPARDILAAANTEKLKDTCCNGTLTEFLSFDAAISLLDRLRPALPPSGRGTMIHVTIAALRARSVSEVVQLQVSFARWRSGSKRKLASVRLACPAVDKRDKAAKQLLQATADALGLKIGKPSYQAPLGLGAPAPDPVVLFNRYQAFQAAFDQATDVVADRGLTIEGLPLLMPRFEASNRRLRDVLAGRSEDIDLLSHLKRKMRDSDLGYELESADSELVLFAKPLTPLLQARLTFERFHNQGLGKSFTALVGVGFPRDSTLQVGAIAALFQKSLFRLFHRTPDQPSWTYSSSEELSTALDGCLTLLRQTLPILETRFAMHLDAPVQESPRGESIAGALSAREAESIAREMALRWAEDVSLKAVSSMTDPTLRALMGPATDETGRLRPHGFWQVSYESARRGAYLLVSVRHTGSHHWEVMSRVPQALMGTALVPANFVDNTQLAESVLAEGQKLAEGTQLRVVDVLWRLGSFPRWDSEVVWTVHLLLSNPEGRERRDRYLSVSATTGTLIAAQDIPDGRK